MILKAAITLSFLAGILTSSHASAQIGLGFTWYHYAGYIADQERAKQEAQRKAIEERAHSADLPITVEEEKVRYESARDLSRRWNDPSVLTDAEKVQTLKTETQEIMSALNYSDNIPENSQITQSDLDRAILQHINRRYRNEQQRSALPPAVLPAFAEYVRASEPQNTSPTTAVSSPDPGRFSPILKDFELYAPYLDHCSYEDEIAQLDANKRLALEAIERQISRYREYNKNRVTLIAEANTRGDIQFVRSLEKSTEFDLGEIARLEILKAKITKGQYVFAGPTDPYLPKAPTLAAKDSQAPGVSPAEKPGEIQTNNQVTDGQATCQLTGGELFQRVRTFIEITGRPVEGFDLYSMAGTAEYCNGPADAVVVTQFNKLVDDEIADLAGLKVPTSDNPPAK